MKVKELIKKLQQFDADDKVLVGGDEELNSLYGELEVSQLTSSENNPLTKTIVIYGLDGSEVN